MIICFGCDNIIIAEAARVRAMMDLIKNVEDVWEGGGAVIGSNGITASSSVGIDSDDELSIDDVRTALSPRRRPVLSLHFRKFRKYLQPSICSCRCSLFDDADYLLEEAQRVHRWKLQLETEERDTMRRTTAAANAANVAAANHVISPSAHTTALTSSTSGAAATTTYEGGTVRATTTRLTTTAASSANPSPTLAVRSIAASVAIAAAGAASVPASPIPPSASMNGSIDEKLSLLNGGDGDSKAIATSGNNGHGRRGSFAAAVAAANALPLPTSSGTILSPGGTAASSAVPSPIAHGSSTSPSSVITGRGSLSPSDSNEHSQHGSSNIDYSIIYRECLLVCAAERNRARHVQLLLQFDLHRRHNAMTPELLAAGFAKALECSATATVRQFLAAGVSVPDWDPVAAARPEDFAFVLNGILYKFIDTSQFHLTDAIVCVLMLHLNRIDQITL
jgi:hypothetical protein